MTTKILTDTALAGALNRQAHRGGKLTDSGFWYSDDARPACVTYALGHRDWTAAKVNDSRIMREHASAMGRKGGQAKSAAKTAAVRENAKLGWRPKKAEG